MSYIFLLGAGASVEAGLPTANQLTDKVLEHFEGSYGGIHSVLRYTQTGLMFEDSKRQGSGRQATAIDIERLLNVVYILSQRDDLDLDPFIGSWESSLESLDYPNPSAQVYGNQEARNFIGKLSSHINDGVNRRSRSSGFLDHDFVRAVRSVTGRPRGKSRFSATVKESTSCLKSLLYVEESQNLEYLNPIRVFAGQGSPVPVATLNYDNVFESFCTQSNISYSIGVEKWSKRFEVTPPQEVFF